MTDWPSDMAQVTHIIWLQTAFLGDIILTTAGFDLCKSLWPNKNVILLTTPVGKQALKDHPSIDYLFEYPKKGPLDTLRQFRKIKTQLQNLNLNPTSTILLQAHRSVRSSLLAKYLGYPTATFRESSFSFLATKTVPRVAVWHEANRNALLLEACGIDRYTIKQAKPSLLVNPNPQSDIHFNLPAFSGKLIGMACGSVWGTKRWLPESFAELAKYLVQSQDIGLVLIGSTAERDQATLVENACKGISQNVWNLTGMTNFDDLRWLFPKLSLLISNDSSPIHYASAFAIPTVAIFGATTSQMGFGPLAPHSQVVENQDLACRPCSDHGPKTCPLNHFACMTSIRPSKVFEVCQQILSKS